MDPITGAIVAALAAGLGGGVTEVGKKMVVSAYDALKAAIEKRCGAESEVSEAIETLEETPDSEGRRATLAEEVADAALTEDDELVRQAEDLIAALKASAAGQQALSQVDIRITGSEVGVIGDDARIEGGIHFGSTEE